MDYIFFFLVTYTTGSAQSLTGCVVDEQHAPLEFVSVVLLDSTDKKPLAFTRTDADGYFALSCPEGKRGILTFNLLGFVKDSIDIQHFKSGQAVVLKEHSYNLKEVKIKAPRIAQRGDTLTYLVNVFKQRQDRSIADVIANYTTSAIPIQKNLGNNLVFFINYRTAEIEWLHYFALFL